MPRSVVTQLMFDGRAEEAMTLYISLFNGSVTSVEKYGPGEIGTEGSVKRAEFTLGGHQFPVPPKKTIEEHARTQAD